MNMDELLEFLRQSTESLHTNVQELSAAIAEQGRQHQIWIERQKAQEEKAVRLRRAMLEGIRTFLEGLDQ